MFVIKKNKKNPRRRDNIRVYDGGNSYERNAITMPLGEVLPHVIESSCFAVCLSSKLDVLALTRFVYRVNSMSKRWF